MGMIMTASAPSILMDIVRLYIFKMTIFLLLASPVLEKDASYQIALQHTKHIDRGRRYGAMQGY